MQAADDAMAQARHGAFLQGLQQAGWTIGRNVQIETRWAGDAERLRTYVAELVALAPDVILGTGNAGAAPLLQATRTVPIVFVIVIDPVGAGFVQSLARPGGNVTGLSIQTSDTAGKRLELLRELVPGLRRLAILANSGNPGAVLDMGEVQAAARALGLDVITLEIHRGEDVAPAFEALKGRAEALCVVPDALVNTNRVRINTLALSARLPTMHGVREYVEAGGLMSYGASVPDQYRRAVEIVDKILRGAKPGDIPVEQPTKFDLVINLTTAKALALTIPESFLLRADEVIE
jgi:putative tryptophan/tyrosine transport system substrate-binding protein